jgi:hypothetical protein
MIPVISYSTKKFPWMDVFAASAVKGGVELVQIVNDTGARSEKCKSFVHNYRHLSPNPLAFELACFERYFAISDYASEKGWSSFFMSDADIVFNDRISDGLSRITEGIDVMLSRPHRDGHSDLIEYSPHFSFWTKESIDDFIEFLLKTYSSDEGKELIERTYQSNKVIAPYAGVSDMTLCHLWMNAQRPRFRNSVSVEEGITVDHNIAMGDHNVMNQFKKRNGIKSLDVVGGKLVFQDKSTGYSYPLVIHFQGKYKMMMKDVLNRKLTRAYSKAAFVSGARIAKWIASKVA